MTVLSFADTNVVVYMLDADPGKRRAAIAVMRTRPVINVQVINEFISVSLVKMKLPRPTVNRLTGILMRQCEVIDQTRETIRHAIELGERYPLSHWDALIVAAALQAGCEILYSEDLQDGQVFEARLRISNPFANLGSV